MINFSLSSFLTTALKKLFTGFSIVIFATFTGILVFEYLAKKNKIGEDIYQWENRYMLFKGEPLGPVFKNVEKFFLYIPNANIHSTTYYAVKSDWTLEYDYHFLTNNYGLVQKKNLRQDYPSLILLGDSYTEGQGSSPWFENFSSNFPDESLQLINGGLLGTGFEQWLLLLEYLKKNNIHVSKVVVIYISDDYRRSAWNFTPNTLSCINNYHACEGNENFYGMPDKNGLLEFLEKMRGYRKQELDKANVPVKDLKYYFSNTYKVWQSFSQKNKIEISNDFPANTLGIQKLIASYGQNLLFINLPQKDEVVRGEISPLGIVARGVIEKSGGEIYDGFSKCNLKKEDFFALDGHPNSKGYQKISLCVQSAIQERWQLENH